MGTLFIFPLPFLLFERNLDGWGKGGEKVFLHCVLPDIHTKKITFMCSDWLVWLGLSESSIEQLQAFCASGCVFFFPPPVRSMLYYDSRELLFMIRVTKKAASRFCALSFQAETQTLELWGFECLVRELSG